MSGNESMEEKIQLLRDRLQHIQADGDRQEQYLKAYQPGQNVEANVQNEIDNDLNQIKSSIQTLSKVCLNRMVSSNEQLLKMEVELQHVDGLLKAVKANAGRELITPPSASTSLKKLDDQFLPKSTKLSVNFPSYRFRMNINALSCVGRHMSDINNNQPLIIKMDANNPPPQFWSRTNDFFIPIQKGSLNTIFKTSFSDFYGFNAEQSDLLYNDAVFNSQFPTSAVGNLNSSSSDLLASGQNLSKSQTSASIPQQQSKSSSSASIPPPNQSKTQSSSSIPPPTQITIKASSTASKACIISFKASTISFKTSSTASKACTTTCQTRNI